MRVRGRVRVGVRVRVRVRGSARARARVRVEVEGGEVTEGEHEDGRPVEEDRVRDRVERVGVGHLRVDLRRVAHRVGG